MAWAAGASGCRRRRAQAAATGVRVRRAVRAAAERPALSVGGSGGKRGSLLNGKQAAALRTWAGRPRAARRGCSCTSRPSRSRWSTPSRRIFGRMKTMRLVLSVWRLRVLNNCAEHRDAAEVGHALLAADVAVLDQAAQHDDAAVFDEHVGADGALVGDEAVRVAGVAGERRALELDLELHQRASALICGVILRMVPTSSRWTVVKGFTSPLLPVLPVLVYEPVMNGTSCATLSSASWLSIVTADGVAMMLVFESPWMARSIAAKFTPVAAMRPMPKVVPVLSADAAHWQGCRSPAPAAARFTPPTGCWKVPSGVSLSSSRPHGPVHAELGVLVHVDVDDDRFDQHLHAADVELVDHAHERAHDLGGRGDDQRVGLGLGPDGGGAVGARRDAAARRRRPPAARPW